MSAPRVADPNETGASMLIQLTIRPARGMALPALRHALRAANVQLDGELRRVDGGSVELRIVAVHAADVSGLCGQLVNCRLAEKVSVQRLDL